MKSNGLQIGQEFEIREIPRSEENVQATFDVCRDAFSDVVLDKLRSNWVESHPNSTFIGAYRDGKLVAVNGFLAHSVIVNGVASLAFQSCWSATRAACRGKGLFSRIINEAKIILSGRCAFLCGFPNGVSGPIFTEKLGFQSVPMVRNAFLTRGPERALQAQIDTGRWFAGLENANLVRFDQHALSEWKDAESGGLYAVDHNTNFIWGKMGTRRIAGVDLRVFLAGGMEVNKPQLFGRLMAAVSEATGASVVRCVSACGGLVGDASRWTRDGARTEPFIFFPVDCTVDGLKFDAHTGMKDVY